MQLVDLWEGTATRLDAQVVGYLVMDEIEGSRALYRLYRYVSGVR